MNRRTRRAGRRLRRGDVPEPLLLITDDRADLIDAAALLGRFGYRYRSELLPFAAAGALALVGTILHGQHVTPWSVALVGVVVAAGLCWPRVAPLLRPLERGYAVAVVLAAAGWLAAATHYGPGTAPGRVRSPDSSAGTELIRSVVVWPGGRPIRARQPERSTTADMTRDPGSPMAAMICGQAVRVRSTRTLARRRRWVHHGTPPTIEPATSSSGSGAVPGP